MCMNKSNVIRCAVTLNTSSLYLRFSQKLAFHKSISMLGKYRKTHSDF